MKDISILRDLAKEAIMSLTEEEVEMVMRILQEEKMKGCDCCEP